MLVLHLVALGNGRRRHSVDTQRRHTLDIGRITSQHYPTPVTAPSLRRDSHPPRVTRSRDMP